MNRRTARIESGRDDDGARRMRTKRCEPSLAGRECEGAIGGRDQPAGEADPLGLIAVEQALGGAAVQHRRELPGQIDRVADAGVHSLPAGGAVDVRGVAEQKGAALAETLRHAVVHAIGREPVDLPDSTLRCSIAWPLTSSNVKLAGVARARSRTVPIRRARPAAAGRSRGSRRRRDRRAVRRRSRARRLDVGDVEEVPVGAAGKAGADVSRAPSSARRRSRRGRRRVDSLLRPSGPRSVARDAIDRLGEADELGLALDARRRAASSRSIRSRSCSSCGKICRKGYGRQPLADVAKWHAGRACAPDPQVDRWRSRRPRAMTASSDPS